MAKGISKMLRKAQPGVSDLAGSLEIYAYTVDQFDDSSGDWPTRTLAAAAIAAASVPLVADAGDFQAARIKFDMDNQGQFKADGFTTVTQFGFKHSLAGKLANYTEEQLAALNDYYGKDLILLVLRPNGAMVVLGSLFKPMRLQVSSDGGNKADSGYVGHDVSFMQVDAVDFLPPILGDDFTLTVMSVPAYS